MDATALPWRKFNPFPQADSENWWAQRAMTLAEDWLGDFGINLGPWPSEFARAGRDRWAFRINVAGKAIEVRVDIDEDGSIDGQSKACRVEVDRV